MKLKYSAILLLCAGVLSACTLDPAYRRPEAPVATTWPTGAAYTDTSAASRAPLASDLDWHAFFKDPYLRSLIETGLANNRDLRVAALDVAEYEANYRIARANLGPTVDASGSATRENMGSALSSYGSGGTYSTDSLSVGITSWEIDFFGRLRSLKRQALEQYLSTDAARVSTQLSLIATIATDYLQLRSDQSLLTITRNTVAADQQTYDLTLQMMQAGSASMQDVREAENSLASARASLASYARAVAQDRNNLVAEIGGPLPDGLPDDATMLQDQGMLADISAGVPSDLLMRRPDIVEAEHTLKAANANIGAARAAFFPKIELTASAGAESGSLSSLFKAGSGAWTFAPTITLPIFDFGYNKANLDVAKIEKNIDVANYEKAIQTAFKEVANALTGRATYVAQVDADQEYVASAQNYYNLAQARYARGTDSFLTLLDAQRTLYTAQQQLITDTLSKLSNLVTLYKTLGGGWSATATDQVARN
jgi:multidrug efflux system outer membrane protein